MKVINIAQNTEEWQDFKLGKSGGSSMKDLYPARTVTRETAVEYLTSKGVEVDPKAKAGEVLAMLTPQDLGEIKAQGEKKDGFYKLVAERIARPITPNDYADRLNGQPFSMMVRGHLLESEIIAEFEKANKVKVQKRSIIWQRDDNPDSIFSPDAETEDETWSVEAKAPDSHKIIRAWDEDKLPDEYFLQAVKAFVTNDKLKRHTVCLGTDVMPALSFIQFDIYREQIEDEIAEIKSFEDAILKQVNELAARLAF